MIQNLLSNGLLSLLAIIVGIIVGRFVKPYANANQERLARFKEISEVLDRITDFFVLQFPNSKLANYIDEILDKAIIALGMKKTAKNIEILRRELFVIMDKKEAQRKAA